MCWITPSLMEGMCPETPAAFMVVSEKCWLRPRGKFNLTIGVYSPSCQLRSQRPMRVACRVHVQSLRVSV